MTRRQGTQVALECEPRRLILTESTRTGPVHGAKQGEIVSTRPTVVGSTTDAVLHCPTEIVVHRLNADLIRVMVSRRGWDNGQIGDPRSGCPSITTGLRSFAPI